MSLVDFEHLAQLITEHSALELVDGAQGTSQFRVTGFAQFSKAMDFG